MHSMYKIETIATSLLISQHGNVKLNDYNCYNVRNMSDYIRFFSTFFFLALYLSHFTCLLQIDIIIVTSIHKYYYLSRTRFESNCYILFLNYFVQSFELRISSNRISNYPCIIKINSKAE